MKLQDALRSGTHTPETLTAQLGIEVKPHPKRPHLLFFKYDQITSPMGDPLVQESRGVILDRSNNWEVVSRPFDKFFNYGDVKAPTLDWSTAKVQEKLDGSLIALYWYDGAWQIASNGTPDAGGGVKGHHGTFADLFRETLESMGLGLPSENFSNFTFIFELMTKWNRVVVRHAEPKVTLIGVRRLDGLWYPVNGFTYRDQFDNAYPTVREFPLQSMADIEATFSTLDPLTQEGYVIVDGAFNRVKVKHPGYVALHQMADRNGPKAFVEVVRQGEIAEVLLAFPEWTAELTEIKNRYEGIVSRLVEAYAVVGSLESQKEFALALMQKEKFTAPLFSLRQNKTAQPEAFIRSFLKDYPIKNMMIQMGLKDAT